MTAYYNEWEAYPAQWLRNLIKVGLIADGDVDERSIKDVKSDDLKGYTQCHFFAGIGGWSYALRLAGWNDERPVWTGSCPCQPFSMAGKKKAQDDDRHLWPAWHSLIRECRPTTIFGEQVAAAIAHGWLDEVYQGLETENYAIGSMVLPASSIGAPHRRDRLWFVANASGNGRKQRRPEPIEEREAGRSVIAGTSLAHSADERRQHGAAQRCCNAEGNNAPEQREQPCIGSEETPLANTTRSRTGGQFEVRESNGQTTCGRRSENSCDESRRIVADSASGSAQRSSAQRDERRFQETFLREGWDSHDWNTEPAVGRVADGIPARSHKLRAYGNAIVPQVAQAFIESFMEVRP